MKNKKAANKINEYVVEWYIDYPGIDGLREITVMGKDENDAIEEAMHIISDHLTIGEVNKVKKL